MADDEHLPFAYMLTFMIDTRDEAALVAALGARAANWAGTSCRIRLSAGCRR